MRRLDQHLPGQSPGATSQEAAWNRPAALIDAALEFAARRDITSASALRLIFLIRKAGDKGYAWWKRSSLSKHWHVHETTITRDYKKWAAFGFVKSRPNPFKASSKILIFPWSRAWGESSWNDSEKVASMLPELEQVFRKDCKGATLKRCSDATGCPSSPIYENLKDEREHMPQHHCGEPISPAEVTRQTPNELPEDTEEARRMRVLLEENGIRSQPGQATALIRAGMTQGLAISSIFAFVVHKIEQKRAQNDSVYSAQLLILAISDRVDVKRWESAARNSIRYVDHNETAGTKPKAPYAIEDLRHFVQRNAASIRKYGFGDLADSLELLDQPALYSDPVQLDQRLLAIERDVITRLRDRNRDVPREARAAVDRNLKPYRGKLTGCELAMLEKRFLDQNLLELAGLPRLSLVEMKSCPIVDDVNATEVVG
jgi:hypothetical protein